MNFRFLSLLQAVFIFALAAAISSPASAQTVINAPSGKVGVAYTSYKINSSASGTVVYTATGLPPGLGISSSQGTITGTPTTSGTYTGTVSITDSDGFVNSATIVIPIAAAEGTPSISSATTASGTVGSSFNTYSLTASVPSGANPVTSFNIGTLPPGLSVGGTATAPTITGTPTSSGAYSVALSANSASGTGATSTLTITIAPALTAPVISGSNAQTVAINGSFNYTITASNSPNSYEASGLPVGLSLNTATGQIIGTASAPGVYPVTLRAYNASGAGAPFTLTITVGSLPVISSATTASVNVGMPFSYAITSSPAATSYNIGNLPAGLTANTTSGVISGTPSAVGTSSISISANNATGTGATISLALTIGNAPVVNSSASASGTVGTAFTYSLAATNDPTGYTVGTLPAGLTYDSANKRIYGTPTAAGTTSVSISASNATGAGPTSTVVFTIAPAASSGGGGSSGGGSSGGGGGSVPAVPAPVIVTSPVAQAVTEGSSLTLAVSATGSGLNFQWFKDDKLITGAQSASYVITNASAASAGSYYVYVSNTGGGVNSAKAAVTVNPAPPAGPTITSQPVSATAALGGSATFSVSASGPGPFTYQWRKDGAAIAGATSATLALNGLVAGQAGNYSVVVTNAGGSVTSDAAVLTVGAPSVSGTYFGSFGGSAGSFGLLVRADRTAVFLGYVTGSKVVLLGKDFTVGSSGTFTFSQRLAGSAASDDEFPRAAADVEVAVAGVIAADGTVSGSVSSLNLSFSAPAGAASGSTSAVAGFYQAGAAGNSAQTLALIGPAGDALIVNIGSAGADGGRGTVAADGKVSVTTAANVSVSGGISQGAITLTAGTTTYAGSVDSRNERLLNVSTRSLTGAGGDALIVGFVLSGNESKPVLIRGIGPTLSAFGVGGALPSVRLEVFRGQTSVATGTDWGTANNNPTEVAAVAARVGAFALPANSRDAAMVLTLAPGAYSAVVTGQSGASGVALVEVYDATSGSIPPTQRVVNLATRSTAGAGENALIAGFYVSGSAPKRVLIRGVGPSLTQFGVSGALARPQLSVAQGASVLAQNAGLASSADAAAILAAASQVGAFALPSNAADAAILINLAPGAYTAQVAGVSGATGVALVEVYEIP